MFPHESKDAQLCKVDLLQQAMLIDVFLMPSTIRTDIADNQTFINQSALYSPLPSSALSQKSEIKMLYMH